MYRTGGGYTNHVTNGILLRSDIHILFDLGLIGVDKNYGILVKAELAGSEYEKLQGVKLFIPKADRDRPSPEALASHRKKSGFPD